VTAGPAETAAASTSAVEVGPSTTTTTVTAGLAETAAASTSAVEVGPSTTTTTVTAGPAETAAASTSAVEVGPSTTTTTVTAGPTETAAASTSAVEVGQSTTTTTVTAGPAETAAVDAIPPVTSAGTSTVSDVVMNVQTSVASKDVEPGEVIQSVSPFPHSQVIRERKRKLQAAEVLTSTPCKQKLLEKMNAKKVPQKKTTQAADAKKKQKKQTCRMDKRRGRKPKGILQEHGSRKKTATKTNSNSSQDAKCLICDERFCDSVPGEKWVKCQKCQGWCHVECTENGKSKKTFVCDFCL